MPTWPNSRGFSDQIKITEAVDNKAAAAAAEAAAWWHSR
jgi:hypothetical protein